MAAPEDQIFMQGYLPLNAPSPLPPLPPVLRGRIKNGACFQHRRSTYPGSGDWSRPGDGAGGDSNGSVEAKADAAVAILASAVYLWDFFLSAESHASLGLARDTNAYATLRELLMDGAPGGGGGGGGAGAAAKVAVLSSHGGDAGVDLAVTVGKGLVDMQRQVLRKVRGSVWVCLGEGVC